MAFFTVTPDDVLQAGNKCAQTAQSISAELNRLKAYVTEIEAEYHGVTAANFNTLMWNYQTNSDNLNNALVGISQLLVRAANVYTGTEETTSARVTGVDASMPTTSLPTANL